MYNMKMGVAQRVQVMLCAVTLMLFCVDAAETMDLHQRIQYHFSELQKSLYDLKTTRLHKRSASLNYDEIIYRSLESFCLQLKPNKNALSRTNPPTNAGNYYSTVTDPSTYSPVTDPSNYSTVTDQSNYSTVTDPSNYSTVTDPSNYSTVTDPILSNWTGPDMFPIKIEAERSGDTVYLVFSIIHSVPGFMFRAGSLHYSKIPIDVPPGLPVPKRTYVVANIDSSLCKEEGENIDGEIESDFAFMSQKSHDDNYLTIDTCHFDSVWEGGKRIKQTGVFSELVRRPRFNISSDPNGEVIIENGKNSTIYVDIDLYVRDIFMVVAKIWDRGERKLLSVTLRSEYENFGYDNGQIHVKGENEDLLFVEVVEKTLKNLTNPTHKRYIRTKLKITVNTANGKRSGHVAFIIRRAFEEFGTSNPLVRGMATTRNIKLRFQNRRRVWPRNMVSIQPARKFECNEYGLMYQMRETKNCTVSCYAFGTNIKSIVLRKNHPYIVSPVKSVSYVHGNVAFAMVDMGPVSDAIDGTYRCVVQTQNGKKVRQDMELHTKLFTNITELSLIELNNDTSEITCRANGAQPLNITFFVGDVNGNRKRLDSNNGTTDAAGLPFESQLTIYVPTTELNYPMRYVECLAEGPRGMVSSFLYLREVISQYRRVPRYGIMKTRGD